LSPIASLKFFAHWQFWFVIAKTFHIWDAIFSTVKFFQNLSNVCKTVFKSKPNQFSLSPNALSLRLLTVCQ
jgi:hypothetical protein